MEIRRRGLDVEIPNECFNQDGKLPIVFVNEEKKKIWMATVELLSENRENLEDSSDKYAQGYHDALIDILTKLHLPIPKEHDGYYD